jgi:DNA-binding NarL/FixJ family response regulator
MAHDKTDELLIAKLDAIIRLMVFRMTEGKKQIEQINLLSKAGLGPKAIAEALGTTSGTVRVALANMKKRKVRTRQQKRRRR